jgi:uncharacterized protein
VRGSGFGWCGSCSSRYFRATVVETAIRCAGLPASLKLAARRWRATYNPTSDRLFPNLDADMNRDLEEILQKVSDTVEFSDLDDVGVNTKGIFHNTPIHVVISWRDQIALEVLLNHGAEVNEHGERGFTPLHHAIMLKNHGAINSLLEHGADPTLRNSDNEDALSLARKVGDVDIIKRLVGTSRPTIQ